MPDFKMQFRENGEWGLPLMGTGIICVRNELLPEINRRWIPLTKICEKWNAYGIHPNEFALMGILVDNPDWKWEIYPAKYKFNPISHFRAGEFPSTKLIDDCVLPPDTIIADYHRFPWLKQLMDANPQIKKIVERNKKYIPDDVWDMPFEMFHERDK